MDYFDYNRANRANQRNNTKAEPEYETLTFTGDETIDVSEDHSMTVEEIREYIRSMNSRTIQQRERAGNVVGLRPLSCYA